MISVNQNSNSVTFKAKFIPCIEFMQWHPVSEEAFVRDLARKPKQRLVELSRALELLENSAKNIGKPEDTFEAGIYSDGLSLTHHAHNIIAGGNIHSLNEKFWSTIIDSLIRWTQHDDITRQARHSHTLQTGFSRVSWLEIFEDNVRKAVDAKIAELAPSLASKVQEYEGKSNEDIAKELYQKYSQRNFSARA